MPDEQQRPSEIQNAQHALIVDAPFHWSDAERPERERTGWIRGVLAVTDGHSIVGLSLRRTMFMGAGGRDVLPRRWAGLFEGVLECAELTPNGARTGVRRDAALLAARRALGEVIARDLLAAVVRPGNERLFRRIAHRIPLVTTDQGPLTVAEYLDRAEDGPEAGAGVVHYLAAAESAGLYALLAGARGMRVFDCTDDAPGAERFLFKYAEIWPERVRLNRLDRGDEGSDWLFAPLEADEAKQCAALEQAYAAAFEDRPIRARASRFEPATLPVVLIKPPLLHLNAANPIIRSLAARPHLNDEVGRAALRSLYDNALILRAAAPSADEAESMFAGFNHVIGLMLELDNARTPQPQPRPATYLSCAVTLPEGEPRSEEVFAAVGSVLEDAPYYWQVRRADSPPHGSDVPLDLDEPPAGAALNLAVFAGPTLNQGLLDEISIGQILGLPQLILIDEGHPELPPSFADVPRCTISGLGAALRAEVLAALAGHPEVAGCRGRGYERYLSPSILARLAGVDRAAGAAISARYPTWPEFAAADPREIAGMAGIDVAKVEAMNAELRRLA